MIYFTDNKDTPNRYFILEDKSLLASVEMKISPAELRAVFPKRMAPFFSFFDNFYTKSAMYANLDFGLCQNGQPFLARGERVQLKIGDILIQVKDEDATVFLVYVVQARIVQGKVQYAEGRSHD